jgi:hypothetical protein
MSVHETVSSSLCSEIYAGVVLVSSLNLDLLNSDDEKDVSCSYNDSVDDMNR